MSPVAETPTESTADERACLVVRLATRVFDDGLQAADWLSRPNTLFDGQSPLCVARASVAGCAMVCQMLDGFVES